MRDHIKYIQDLREQLLNIDEVIPDEEMVTTIWAPITVRVDTQEHGATWW